MTVVSQKKAYPSWWLTSAVVGLTLGLSALPVYEMWKNWQQEQQIVFVPWLHFSDRLAPIALQALPSDLMLPPATEQVELAAFGNSDLEETNWPDNGAVCPRPVVLATANLGDNGPLGLSLIDPLAPQFNPQPLTQRLPLPSPEIHPQARLAKVPVMMYHDVLPEKEVYFDLTLADLEEDFQAIYDWGLTPISMDQLTYHLRTGAPLPERPILLSFDDSYAGHYTYVYPLLKRYGFPALFSVITGKLDGEIGGRSTITWDQVKQMAADPLVTISAHTVTHPSDLRALDDEQLRYEVVTSKTRLEEELGIPIRYFTYPEGYYNERVADVLNEAGLIAGLTMSKIEGEYASNSDSIWGIARFAPARLTEMLEKAWAGPPSNPQASPVNFDEPIYMQRIEVDDTKLILVRGGKSITIHAATRYPIAEITQNTDAIAAVDGTFFSLEYLDSNTLVGPAYSQTSGEFIPGNNGDIPVMGGRPLVLISPDDVDFIPFDPETHNTLEGIKVEMPDVTDAFVAGAWLVKDGRGRSYESYGDLWGFDSTRNRAFWGIDHQGRPVVGVSGQLVHTVHLGEILAEAGIQEAVMLDSGGSTSVSYKGESLAPYGARPVPHAVALVPQSPSDVACDPAASNYESPQEP
ncbi:MAG: polysaccharide deacetylase family protein [Cyanobacteria bacterium P01_A01_bin.123]